MGWIDRKSTEEVATSTLLEDYVLADGTRAFTGVVEGVTPTEDSHLATKGYVDDVAGALIEFYLSNTASADVAGYKLLSEDNDVGQSTIAVLGDSNEKAIEEFVTAVGVPNLTKIQQGALDLHFYAKTSSAGNTDKLYQLKGYVYYYDGVTETLIGSVTHASYLTTTTTLYELHIDVGDLVLTNTDRLVVKLGAVRSGSAPRVNDATITLYIGSTNTASHINLPITLAVLDNYLLLNGTRAMTGNLDLDGNDLIIGADGDTYIHEAVDDQLSIIDSGVEQIVFDGGANTTTIKSYTNITKQAWITLPSTNTPTGTTQTIDWSLGNNQILSLASASGNVTLSFLNVKAGGNYLLKIKQHASAAKNIVWPSCVKWPFGITPTISTTVNYVDIVSIFSDGVTCYCNITQGFTS